MLCRTGRLMFQEKSHENSCCELQIYLITVSNDNLSPCCICSKITASELNRCSIAVVVAEAELGVVDISSVIILYM